MKKKRLYFQRLDSLRTIAFLIVFFSHTFYHSIDSYTYLNYISPIFGSGEQGVRIFFVLSGFLITYLLLIENNINNKIDIISFYIRRALRIWPLYYLILITGIFILPKFSSVFSFCGDYIQNLFFLNNFNVHESGKCFNPHILISWSVAIEEQFYLIWPIIFTFSMKKKILPAVCIIGFILSYSYSVFYEYDYFSSFCNINYLFIGCYGGYLYKKHKKIIDVSIIKSNLILLMTIFILMLLTVLDFNFSRKFSDYIFLKELIYPILYILIILNCVCKDSNRTGNESIFSKLGKYTYGMYFYHPLIVLTLKIVYDKLNLNYYDDLFTNFHLSIFSLFFTVIISIFSYEYFEKIFLNYKNNFAIIKTRM